MTLFLSMEFYGDKRQHFYKKQTNLQLNVGELNTISFKLSSIKMKKTFSIRINMFV